MHPAKAAAMQLLANKSKRPQTEAGMAYAPSNIALIKYWGKRDQALNLPVTASLSISLGHLGAHTTITSHQAPMEVLLNDQVVSPNSALAAGIRRYLETLGLSTSLKFNIQMNIPMAAGVASSACGFASIVQALNQLHAWNLNRYELSCLARLGSGSACRSLWHGFVYWHHGQDPLGADSHGEPLSISWPELCIGVVLISKARKAVSSRQAMQHTVASSPLYQSWPDQLRKAMASIKIALTEKNFNAMGLIAESNAQAMHATMQAATPPIAYHTQATVAAVERVQELRASGIPCYYTQDAGPNIKILFEKDHKAAIEAAFPGLLMTEPFGLDATPCHP